VAGRVDNLVPVPDQVRIEEVCEVFSGLVPAIERLMNQLSKSAASRRSRKAANHMYQELGVRARETTVYRLDRLFG
jgi:hypothetical protein